MCVVLCISTSLIAKGMTNIFPRERIEWADNAKAIAICLMVLGHSQMPCDKVMAFLCMFHMPVFFVIAGYFEKNSNHLWESLKKNIKALLVPYFFFSILAFSICWIGPKMHPEQYNMPDNYSIFKAAFIGMFLGDVYVEPWRMLPLSALWFLIALFIVRLTWNILFKAMVKRNYLIICVLTCGWGAAWYFHPNYYSLDSAVLGLILYAIGFLFRKYTVIDKILAKTQYTVFYVTISLLYMLLIGIRNGNFDMAWCYMGKYPYMFWINPIIGSLFCISVAALIKNCKVLTYIGKNTLIILGVHMYFLKFARAFFSIVLHIENDLFLSISCTLLAIVGSTLLVKPFNKYCPKLIGK